MWDEIKNFVLDLCIRFDLRYLGDILMEVRQVVGYMFGMQKRELGQRYIDENY